jgi:cytochrome P450/deferrochelatase/peroxidase EfeB
MDAASLGALGVDFNLGRSDGGQISNGLNLVLELKNRLDMPLLLLKIRQAQRKINAGLGELNFVHYARFLPTRDNSALQVITEFDGPLTPYVLDFAIEIGDVFDLLLSFTRGTDDIVPVAEHPAEFLAFVEENNRVKVAGFKFDDWPLYASYPQHTVLEIIGPRSDLPIPKADREATPVESSDVQGNILRGYRAERVRHYMLRVTNAERARAWLADKATPDTSVGGAVLQIMAATPWKQKPDVMLNIGLTFAGMQALQIRRSWLELLPKAYREGALQRAADNFDTGENAPEHWWLGGPAQAANIHIMVSLYQGREKSSPATFVKAAATMVAAFPSAGLELLDSHDAEYNGGNSWFGYADGVANPRLARRCPVPHDQPDLQPAASVGEFVLGETYRNIYGGSSLGKLPAELAANGSFCALRVLAQDADAFEAVVKSEAIRLHLDPDPVKAAQLLKAKLMGRWIEGAPLALYPGASPGANTRNDFDYAPSYEYPETPLDHDGTTCPVGAHIRRTNPRTSRVAGARYARRLMRRGMHYQLADGQGLSKEVGLFGMFMCGDIERQFEFIQRQWINGDRFAPGLRGTRDPFVGTPEGSVQEFQIPVANGPALCVRLPQVVRTRGSLYLFMPGLRALRQLDRLATTERTQAVALASLAAPTTRQDLDATLESALLTVGARLTVAELLSISRAALGYGPLESRQPAESLQTLAFDPRRRDFQIDPYPTLKRFRADEPVHYSPLYRAWFVFGYNNVVKICTEDGHSGGGATDNFSASKPGTNSPRGLFTLDEPQHGAVRAKVAAAWAQGAANTTNFVKRSLDDAFAAIGGYPCFDLVEDFARPVPRNVYYDILGGNGIGTDERRELDALARRVMKHHDATLDDLQRLDGTLAGLELAKRLGLMLARAALPFGSPYQGSFLHHLARVVDWTGGSLNPVAAVMTLVNLTVAGYMSVEFLLATGIRRLLLDNGRHWQALQFDLAKLPYYLKEMRRTEHALAVVERFAKQDVVVGGIQIRKGEAVFGVLASANRDEGIFGADADMFNPARVLPAQNHVGLGHGTHVCMGRILEDAITTPALSELMTRMPGLRLQSNAQPPWFQNFYFRSFDHLAVTTLSP